MSFEFEFPDVFGSSKQVLFTCFQKRDRLYIFDVEMLHCKKKLKFQNNFT